MASSGGWFNRFVERRACRDTTMIVDGVSWPGSYEPQVRIRILCKHWDLLLGQVFFSPSKAEALAEAISRTAGEVRNGG